MSFLIYPAKTIIIAGLLYGYYLLFLRNKHFHQYNRIFLLCIPFIAMVLPLVHIPFPWLSGQGNGATMLLQVTQGRWEDAVTIRAVHHPPENLLNPRVLLFCVYAILSTMVCLVFFRSIWYIRRISRLYPYRKMGSLRFFETEEEGAPFSFFNLVFWHRGVDLHSTKGQQILRHELFHVRQLHSFDIIFLEILQIFCWFNPFFLLIRKEIKAIHEFLADQFAISGHNRYAYAKFLLLQSIASGHPRISNPFFHNQIKRRISMITKNQSTRNNFLSRAMILPVIFALCCAFAFRFKTNRLLAVNSKKITLIVDAGHGGADQGVIASNGINEKSINLKIAQKMKSLSKDYPIRVVLTRDNDELAGKTTDIRESLQYRAGLAARENADLFLSIHVNADPKDHAMNGFEIYVSDKDPLASKSIVFGSLLNESLKKEYTIANDLKKNDKVLVLKSNTVPAVLVECGYLTNSRDEEFITDEVNQEKIARDLLEAVLKYSQANLSTESVTGPPQTQDPAKKSAATPPPPTEVKKYYEEIIHTKVEVEAEYPGGQEAWINYLTKHIVYPPKALKNGLMGDVVVGFIVDKSGNVGHVKALSGPEELRPESVRIVKESGKWIPAMQNGQKVNAYRKQPVKYRMEEK